MRDADLAWLGSEAKGGAAVHPILILLVQFWIRFCCSLQA